MCSNASGSQRNRRSSQSPEFIGKGQEGAGLGAFLGPPLHSLYTLHSTTPAANAALRVQTVQLRINIIAVFMGLISASTVEAEAH
jgi:hypothetical protein